MTETLQQKIDLDIQLIMDNEFINEVYEKYGLSLSEVRDKLLKMEREHIQELREQIKTMPSCTICPYCKQQTLGRNDILTLIGEKQ